MKLPKTNKTAFSILELSIILVVIGLLIIGITAGSSLIRSTTMSNARLITSSSPVLGIENLALWLETTSKDSFLDGENVDGEGANAPIITTWRNINNQGTKINAISSGEPAYTTGTMNKLPAIDFDGDNDNFEFSSSTFSTNDNFSIFIVTNIDTASVAFSTLLSQKGGTGTGRQILQLNTNKRLSSQLGGSSITGNAPSFEPEIINLNNNNTQANNLTIYQNGVQTISGNTSNDEGANGNFVIGENHNNEQDMDFSVGELIIYDRFLNDEERQSIENYLSKKWGIALD